MRCPLCGVRKARRACPAQGCQICSVCCGSKRHVEIVCPADCVYLASAREHPPAIEIRRYEQDISRIAPLVRDFTRLQGEIFLLLATVIVRDAPTDLQPLLDEDVADASGALAATFETAARGVIYEHRPATRPAERIMTAFRTLLSEMEKAGARGVEREAVPVLRQLEEAARNEKGTVSGRSRAFIDLLGRVVQMPERPGESTAPAPAQEARRLIVP